MATSRPQSVLRQYMGLPWRGKAVVLWRLFCDGRVPLAARLLVPAVVLYVLNPVDIIPDFIPVLGQLDDLLVVLLVVGLFLRFVPRAVAEEHMDRWKSEQAQKKAV